MIDTIGSSIANIDREIGSIVFRLPRYLFNKGVYYLSSYIQNYITLALIDHVNTTIALLEYTENWTDDFLNRYISPFVSSTVGISIGCLRYLLTWDKSKEANKFKYVVINGTISYLRKQL